MSFALWSPDYETGDAEVDGQHRRLFAMINELDEAMARHRGRLVLGPLLEELTDYAKAHFTAEEALMEGCAYPHLERHRHQHAELAERVEEYRLRFEAGFFTLPTTLARFLAEWLKRHIRAEDLAFISWLRERPS